MFFAIVQGTPRWVWAVLAGLVAYGLSQTHDRQVGLARLTTVPLVLVSLSAAGVLGAFGESAFAVGGWLVGAAAALTVGRHAVAARGATWNPATGRLQVPGSWVPLALMLGLFAIKYFVGASLSMQPSRAVDPTFAGLCGLAYGSFAGLFLARSLSLRASTRSVGELRTT